MRFTREFPLRRIVPALVLVVPVLLAGCGGSPPLATVGSRTITVADFEDAARGNAQQYPGVPDSAKRALLEDLVRRALLLEEGTKLHLAADTTIERVRKEAAERLAVEALMKKLVPQDVQVSDAEAKELYEQRNTEGHLMLVFSSDEAQAGSAAKAIAGGEAFGEVAKRINNPALLKADGDLGFVQPGSMVSPLDEWVSKAPIGKLMGPSAAPGFGFFVGKVTERRPHKQEPFDLVKPGLVQMIKVRKMRALQQKAYNGLRDQYRIQVETGGPQALFQRMQQSNAGMIQGMGGRPLPPEPTPADAKVVLGHMDGADGKSVAYSQADALKDLSDPMAQRPDPSNLPSVRQWIESQLVTRAIKIESTRRRMAEDPEVARRSREQVNNMLLQQVYTQQVASRINQPTPDDVQAAFRRHAAQFIQLDEAKVLAVTIRDSAEALALARSLSGPGSLRKAATSAPGATVAEKDLHFPNSDPFWQGQQANLMSANPGDPRGPVVSPHGWVLFELISKQQGPQAFDKLDPRVVQALQGEAAELSRDRVLATYTDSLRKVFKVELHLDRLKRIPWPVLPKTA